MPELKMPPFLVDLYWDLRDRHLLPLVVLAIVAIVAVPFLLGGGSKQAPPPATAGIGAVPSPEPADSKLTVVEAKPGLRDYRKRLRHDSPTDPFKQRFTSPDLAGAKLGGGEEEAPSSSTSSTTSTSTSTSTTKVTKTENSSGSSTTEVTTETNGEPGSAGGSPGGSPNLTLFAFAIDVQVTKTTTTPDGGKDKGEPEIKHRVIPPSPLPGEKAQAVTYMGISPTTRRPFFLIGEGVSGIFGEGKCLSGLNTCQLIELELHMPETFVFGPGDTRYKINVLEVEPVVTGHT